MIGLISDWIRGNNNTPIAHFNALVYAFYIPSFLLIISAVAFGGKCYLDSKRCSSSVAAYTLLADKEKFDIEMGYKQRSAKVTMLKGLDNVAFDEINKNA